MKKFGKIAAAVLIFGLFIVFPAAAQKTRSDFQKMYTDFLKKRKLAYEITDTGDIYFTNTDGYHYWITVNETEPLKFRIYAAFKLENVSRNDAIRAAHYANYNEFGIKVYISDDVDIAFFVFDGILPKAKDFALIFDKAIEVISNGVNYFF